MSWPTPQFVDISPSRISQVAFEATSWTFYGLAITMALVRTGFRVYTLRKMDADDFFLILAVLALTGTVAIIHTLYPSLLAQNMVTLGQLIPGPTFADQMLQTMKLESAASNLTWVTIYSVKYAYMLFFRNLVQRRKSMMIWWWIVLAVITSCAISGFVFHWTICPHFVPNFLEICPISLITAREHVWLIVTTVTDIVADLFIISIPVILLWNVKIPLRSKLSIGAALGLSLFMMIIAIIRISMGQLIPNVSDTVWIYFCWNLECSIAVFMISATAFRSTFGQHKSAKSSKSRSNGSQPSRVGEKVQPHPNHSRPISYENETKTVYQMEVEEMSIRNREIV